MEILVWLVPGVLVGWTAAVLLRRGSASAMLAHLALGVAGAACGSWLLGPAMGVPLQPGSVVAANLQMAVLGAILLLAAANLLVPPSRRANARRRPAVRSTTATTSGEQPARG